TGPAVRVLFLIGDAPPHLEKGTPYTVTARHAVERGIKVFTVACSGMDDTGEFVWRQLAALTLARFVFLSYGGGTEHHVGPYEVESLDQIMVRAVREEVTAVLSPTAPRRVPFQPQAVAPYATAPTYVTQQPPVSHGP